MLIRLVRMTFQRESLAEFHSLFDESAELIRAFPGCNHLELWQDAHDPTVLTTYSLWDSEHALTAYRESPLFLDTWEKARSFFSAPPVAASHVLKRAVSDAEPNSE